jgi:hypothetical protein
LFPIAFEIDFKLTLPVNIQSQENRKYHILIPWALGSF